MPDYKGIDYLRNKLNLKKSRVRMRYKHYEMKNIVRDFNISTPPDLRYWMGTLGWCAKAVDSLADRLVFREFDNDVFDMNSIFKMNIKAKILFFRIQLIQCILQIKKSFVRTAGTKIPYTY